MRRCGQVPSSSLDKLRPMTNSTDTAGKLDEAGSESTPTWVTILGSCVSRDTLETMPRNEWPIDGYLARTSLISAGTDASANVPEKLNGSSKFQLRNVWNDIRGDLVATLRGKTNSSVLLWDLVDERHGVYEFPDGAVITRSIDVLAIPELVEAVKNARHIEFGSDEHFWRWSGAAGMFVGALSAFGLKERTLVLAADWAEKDVAGNSTPWSMGKAAPEANRQFQRYYEHLEQLGLRVVRFQELTADPEHRWGLAPFHYTPETYAAIRSTIEEFVTGPQSKDAGTEGNEAAASK